MKQNDFYNLIKQPNVKVFFQRGSNTLDILYNNDIYSFKPKLNININDIKNIDKIKLSQQYKMMLALNFKTRNGKGYTYNNKKISFWITFNKSKIHKMAINEILINRFMFIPDKVRV